MKKLLKSLSETEFQLVQETERDRLRQLDEDDLIELHSRIRKARNKHVTVYRREAAAAVSNKASRGAARKTTARNAARVEVFEAALGRVSRRLGAVAKQNAASLKEARLAAARSDAPSFAVLDVYGPTPVPSTKRKPKSAGRKKREASDIAAGAQRQAKKDKRG